MCRSSKGREKQLPREMPDKRLVVLGQSDLRQKNNYKVVRDGKMGSRKRMKMDIVVGFKQPTWVRTRADFQTQVVVFQEPRPYLSRSKAHTPCGDKGAVCPGDENTSVNCPHSLHGLFRPTPMPPERSLPQHLPKVSPPPNLGQHFPLRAKILGFAPLRSSERICRH